MSLIYQANALAKLAHKDQVRKYTNLPYITHPQAVMWILDEYGTVVTPEMRAAALLHDTVEDCAWVTHDMIRDLFGEVVYTYVWHLTDDDRGPRNRLQHKLDLADRWRRAPWQAKMVKIADLIDNTSSIIEHDPNFAKVYIAEKAHLLMALSEREGFHYAHRDLWMAAWEIIRKYDRRVAYAATYGAGLRKLLRLTQEK